MDKSLLEIAFEYVGAGLSVLPVKTDETKAPAVFEWKEFQSRRPTPQEIRNLFARNVGIGILGGAVSGNLEIIDFDVSEDGYLAFDDWFRVLSDHAQRVVRTMPKVRTAGGGIHLYYRSSLVEGNKKLAQLYQKSEGDQRPKIKTIIETRGEGGYVIAPGSPPECHETLNTYDLISGSLDEIPYIADDIRTELFSAAYSFDQVPPESIERSGEWQQSKSLDRKGKRPGDDFEERVSWRELLESLGWRFWRQRGDAEHWTRPGKDRGTSATIRSYEGQEILYNFSPNAWPLVERKGYTKFSVYALYNHDGDWAAAAKALADEGYGEQNLGNDSFELNAIRDDDVPWSDEPPDFEASVNVPSTPRSLDVPDDFLSGPEGDDPGEDISPEEDLRLSLERDAREAQARAEQHVRIERQKKAELGPSFLTWPGEGDPPELKYADYGDYKGRPVYHSKFANKNAYHFLEREYTDEEGHKKLIFKDGAFYRYNGRCFDALSKDNEIIVKRDLVWFLARGVEYNDEEDIYNEYDPTSYRVNSTFDRAKELVNLGPEHESPAWLDSELSESDPREIVPCRNGLLDVRRRNLLSNTPAFFSTNSIDVDYNPYAPRPTRWMQFLDEILPGDAESQDLLQMWFGYCLTEDTRMQKMLFMIGPKRCGKGTIISVLQQIIGRSFGSMNFHALQTNFGLMSALNKTVLAFPDARVSGKMDQAKIVADLLSISGEDSIRVDRKNMTPIDVKLGCRIMLASNELPKLHDTSNALIDRVLLIRFFKSFYGKEDVYLRETLSKELDGILNWAIEGWHKLQLAGKFFQPKSGLSLLDAMKERSSPIISFVEQQCVLDAAAEIKISELFEAWKEWCEEEGYSGNGNKSKFSSELQTTYPQITTKRPREGDGRRTRMFSGIDLDSATQVPLRLIRGDAPPVDDGSASDS